MQHAIRGMALNSYFPQISLYATKKLNIQLFAVAYECMIMYTNSLDDNNYPKSTQ